MSTPIATQVHGRFKVFTGPLAADGTFGDLGEQVSRWASSAKVAPKSIGVEYLESAKKLLLSIGYRDDEPGYGVTLACRRVGTLGALDAADVARLEKLMAEASAKVQNIICHELYVTDANELLMVFMSHRAG
jgi:hypothetical protein